MDFLGRLHCAYCFAAVVSLTGCASIVSGRHAEVSIYANAPNAHVVVRDKRGQEVASVHTPGRVTLKRKDRLIFPARYTATIAAPGYETAQVPIRSTVNPWVLGNIVFGGIPGLVIDNATGAAWKPRDSEIYQELVPLQAAHAMQPYSVDHPAGPRSKLIALSNSRLISTSQLPSPLQAVSEGLTELVNRQERQVR
jgi:hypothetical protein